MMQNSRKEKIIAALLSNSTIAAAASSLGITEKTIYNYMDKPEFKQAYEAARAHVVKSAATQIQGRMTRAIEVIAGLMDDEGLAPYVRLNAAKAILESSLKLSEHADIVQRLEELEGRVTS